MTAPFTEHEHHFDVFGTQVRLLVGAPAGGAYSGIHDFKRARTSASSAIWRNLTAYKFDVACPAFTFAITSGGIAFAGEPWVSMPWRLTVAGSPSLSGPRAR